MLFTMDIYSVYLNILGQCFLPKNNNNNNNKIKIKTSYSKIYILHFLKFKPSLSKFIQNKLR